MSLFLTILHVFVCFVLILVILLQAGRGQGLASASFGSGNVQSLFGTRASDFMTKATTVAAICFLLTCIGLDLLEARKSKSLLQISNQSAPLDMEQVKKALEKVQSESGGGATAEAVQGALDAAAGDASGAQSAVLPAASPEAVSADNVSAEGLKEQPAAV